MSEGLVQAIVKKVDRLVVRSPRIEPLYEVFTQQLLLPGAWPITTNPFYTSGGVQLGNLNLELIQFRDDPQGPHARCYGLGFELLPYDISLPAMKQRGIQHTPPAPFYLFDDEGWQITTWSNIYLGGLLGSSPWSKLFFTASRAAPNNFWERGTVPTLFNRKFRQPFLYQRAFKHGMVFAVEYNPVWHSKNILSTLDHAGLELRGVFEITVGVRSPAQARERWHSLLRPHPEVADGVWQLPDNLHIRLVENDQDELLGMILQVQSLNRVAQFLHRRGLLRGGTAAPVAIDPTKVQGLSIRFVQ